MKILKLGLILCLICAIAAGALTLIYNITKPKIAMNEENKRIEYRKAVLPDADYFKPENKDNVFIGYKDNKKIGLVVMANERGYSGDINMIIGIDNNEKITGLKIVKQTETPGLGAKIELLNFLDQFLGLKINELYLKKDNPDGKIDAITGATISSRAVANGLRKTLIQLNKKSPYKDGIFKAKAQGTGIVSVEVKIEAGDIIEIKAEGQYENKKYWKQILEKINPIIINDQSTKNVDIVTGATKTSKAYIKAINDALKQSKNRG